MSERPLNELSSLERLKQTHKTYGEILESLKLAKADIETAERLHEAELIKYGYHLVKREFPV